MKSIQSKLAVIFGIFLALGVTGIVIVTMNSQQDDGTVINLAGKQRMLTQKMSKEAIALSQGIGSKKSLTKTVYLFDKTLKGLISGNSELKLPKTQNNEILNQLNHVQKLWKDLHVNLDVVLTNSAEITAALSYVNENNIKLLKEMNKAVGMLEKKASDPVKINLAGKQRMLTQKMTKEAIALSLGLDSKKSLQETANLFDKTLKGLISGNSELKLTPVEDPKIVSQLNHVQKLWKSFQENVDTVLTLAPETNDALAYINANNVVILKEMNKAVGMYEAESGRKASILQWSNIIVVVVTVITVIVAWISVVRPLINMLRNLVARMADGSKEVSDAAEQVSNSSQTLAQGSSEQASSLEETSSTMEEISTMTKLNADNAQEAANLAQKCNDSAEKGNVAVGEMCNSIDKMNSTSMEIVDSMSDSMDEINRSSNEIAEITKVIDGIAFQTNLLALNAAVEAARAGEHGKGFAVVAEEVRNLAQRSAAAAKDTAVLIKDCVAKANNGTTITNKCRDTLETIVEDVKKSTDNTNAALQEIVSNVGKVNVLTNEIATASCEQSDGVSSVNSSVQQMDQVTQQNAATAEEVASTSEEMSAQAQTLLELIGDLESHVSGKHKSVLKDGQDNFTGHKEINPITKKSLFTSHANANRAKNGDHGNTQDITPESIIPMEESGVVEHSERFSDF